MIVWSMIADGGSSWPVVGRLHPLVIHFPIAMILTAGVIELLLVIRRDARSSPVASCCTWIGTIGACAAAWTGWSFGEEHGSGLTLELHRWFGVACAGILIVAVIGWSIERTSTSAWSLRTYRLGLWIGAVLVVVSSFFGGEMVWGEGFLLDDRDATATSAVPASSTNGSEPVDPADPDTAPGPDLEHQVVLLMQEQCAACHGPEKQKGKLQLIPLAKAFPADRRDRWSIIPGDPEASTVIQRVTLPPDHYDIMPPKGDVLNGEQVDLLRRWISEGAPHAGATASDPSEARAAEPSPASSPQARIDIDPADLEAGLQAIRGRGGVIVPRHVGSSWYELTVSFARPLWTDGDLALLEPLRPVLWSLDLGNSGVTDAGMPLVADCNQLRELNLDRTRVGSRGVESCAELVHLETLDLHSTAVNDAALPSIRDLPALQAVYLWDTGVSKQAAEGLRTHRPGLHVECGVTAVEFESGSDRG
tara:strand:- start:2524 stop:3954 length:1431 start_codon:yes stop_codon:yes gene_type:complete